MTAAIRVNQLSKSYGTTRAVADLSFVVEDGEFLGFLGPNGAGKTTTIRILTGIVRPDGGQVEVGGLDLTHREAIAREIGVVPESRGFYDWMTASEYLAFFSRAYRRGRPAELRAVDRLLEQVDLTRSRHIRVGAFSRGMKQRLGLARALVNRPRILFLDEPTLGLDPQGQQDIKNLLRQLNADGVTVFFSSHLLSEVAELCSRIVVIDQGRLVGEGTMDDLRRKAGLKTGWHVRAAGDPDALASVWPSAQVVTLPGALSEAEGVFLGDRAEANRVLDSLRARRLEVLQFAASGQNLEEIFLALTRREKTDAPLDPTNVRSCAARGRQTGGRR